ncbi:MAG TPA: GAF domain-containing protein [Solirubrobacteraceae bacterium]|nr:GAF domain-containing protein [Solirubrobacteraceae bacterium]
MPESYAALLATHMAEAGWQMDSEHADGADELSAALARRGWNAVLYGGDDPGAVPARKALALTRLADPHLPFVAVSPNVRRGDLSSIVRGLDDAAMVISNPKELAPRLARELDAARLRRRVGSAHHVLLAQQTIADHLVAGLDSETLCERVLATLGETLGWRIGTIWRPSDEQSVLRAAAVWHQAGASPELLEFAEQTREERFAPGQGVPGRVWAFRRPSWISDLSRDERTARSTGAMRAGLMTAVAFPLAVGDGCEGVIEFLTTGVNESNGEIAAMFATVGAQLAQYLDRRRQEQAESRRLHAQLDRTRGFLDAAGALIVVLDPNGCVLLANARACNVVGFDEADLIGRDWFSLAVPKGGRPAARAAFDQLVAGEADGFGHRLPSAEGQRRAIAWHGTVLDDEGGVLMLGHAEVVAQRAAIAAAG